MASRDFSADSYRPFVSLFALVTLLLSGGCGSGSGSASGPDVQVTPQPPTQPTPIATPPRGPTPTPQPTAEPEAFDILLREGGTSHDGIEIASIDEARFGAGGDVGVIVGAAVPGRPRVLLSNDGANGDAQFSARIDMRDYDALDSFRELRELRPDGAGGWFVVAGEELLDRAFLRWTEAGAEVISDTRDEFASFERLAAADAARGLVAFVAGWPGCTQTEEGSDRCPLGIVREYAEGEFKEVVIEGTDLSLGNPKSPHLLMTDSGGIYLSLPGRDEEPMIVEVDGGQVITRMKVDTELPGIGQLLRPELVQLSDTGVMILRATLVDDPRPRPAVLIRWADGPAEVVARVDSQGVPGGVANVGSIGVSDDGTLLYQVVLRPEEGSEATPRSLRRVGAGGVEVLATEGQLLPGSGLHVIKIEDPFQNRHGEVAFVAELGTIETLPEGVTTTIILESQVVRVDRDGNLRSLLSSRTIEGVDSVSDLEILDFSDEQELLVGVEDEDAGGVLLVRLEG